MGPGIASIGSIISFICAWPALIVLVIAAILKALLLFKPVQELYNKVAGAIGRYFSNETEYIHTPADIQARTNKSQVDINLWAPADIVKDIKTSSDEDLKLNVGTNLAGAG